MEIPATLRALLIIAYTVIQTLYKKPPTRLSGRSGAPVASRPRGRSRNGKTDISDRGGSFHSPKNFKHNVFSQIRIKPKLIPALRLGIKHSFRMRKPNIILNSLVYACAFNIIYIIALSISKYYLACVQRDQPFSADPSASARLGMIIQTGSFSKFGPQLPQCVMRVRSPQCAKTLVYTRLTA
jgi:hypothetical protein